MKVLRLLSVVALSMIMTTAFAQQRGMGQGRRNLDPEEAAKQQITQMKEFIKISSQEENACKEIFVKYGKERQKMFQGMQQGGDRTQMREDMQNLMEKQNKELKEILGQKKYDKYSEKLQELRQNRRRGI